MHAHTMTSSGKHMHLPMNLARTKEPLSVCPKSRSASKLPPFAKFGFASEHQSLWLDLPPSESLGVAPIQHGHLRNVGPNTQKETHRARPFPSPLRHHEDAVRLRLARKHCLSSGRSDKQKPRTCKAMGQASGCIT